MTAVARRGCVVAALVETERWVLIGHQGGVGDDAVHPSIETHHEVEDRPRVAAGEQQGHGCEQHQEADEPGGLAGPAGVGRLPPAEPPAAAEQRDDQVLGERQQPPLDEHQAAGEVLGVLHAELRRVVGRPQAERRVAVGSERAVGVVADPPTPPQHTDVEVEQPAWIAAREQDGEEGDDADDGEGDPQEDQHDVVRDGQQPLDQPQTSAELGIEVAGQSQRVRRRRGRTSIAGCGRRRHRVAGAGHCAAAAAGTGSPCRASPRPPKITSTAPPARTTSPAMSRPIRAGSNQSTLIPESGVDVHAATGVGVHQHHGPVAALHLPRQFVRRVGRHLGHPERLLPGRLRRSLARDTPVEDAVGGELDVADRVAGNSLEEVRHVGGGADAGEDRRVRPARIDAQPDSAQRPPIDQPIRLARLTLQVDAVRRDRVRR